MSVEALIDVARQNLQSKDVLPYSELIWTIEWS